MKEKMAKKCFMLVHYDCEIQDTKDGVTFCCKKPVLLKVCSSMTVPELHSKILQKLHQENKQITQFLYRIPMLVSSEAIRYGNVVIDDDDDVSMMFDSHGQFPEIRVMEVFVSLGDSQLCSRESAPEPTFAISSQVQNENAQAQDKDNVMGSPSFPQPATQDAGEFPRDVPCDNDDNDAVPATQTKLLRTQSSPQSQSQLVGHYSSLNLEAMQVNNLPGFNGIVDGGNTVGENELHEGQHFPNKEAVLHAVKHYSIQEGVEYKVFESSHTKPLDGDNDDNDAVPATQTKPLRTQSSPQSQSQWVGHYSSLNLEAMQVNNPPGFNGIVDGGNTIGENELHEGQHFPNKEAVLHAVKHYSIQKGVEYKVFESSHTIYQGKCKQFGNGCNWSIRVINRRKKGLWEIRKYNGEHTCSSPRLMQNHPKLDSNIIAADIYSMINDDPMVSIGVLQELIHSKYDVEVSYRKVWLAKQKAIAKIYGDWEESYDELPKWLQALQTFMPGTIVELSTRPYDVENVVDHTCAMFHRLFWTFPPCVEAFKYCKPLVSVDGTHLYGKYGGTLLLAIAHDGNSNILPIAFAVVEGETKEAWSFFLTNLRRHVTPQEGLLIVSNMNDAIKGALDAEDSWWHPPRAHHTYCIRHIASNFELNFKSKDAKQALINAAYSKTRREFLHYYGLVRGENPDFGAWLDRIPVEKWTQHQDEGRRFGCMTTSLSECINAILKGVRNLPVTALVRSTYYRLAELFVIKGKEAEAQLAAGRMYSQALIEAIETTKQSIGTMTVSGSSQGNESFIVEERAPIGNWGQRNYKVRLADRWCDCGYFQALHYPCRHVLAVCTYAQLDWSAYVHDVYRMQNVFNVYRLEFTPVANEGCWPQYNGPRIRPNPELSRNEGRPISKRIRKEMDEVESGHGKCCRLCKQEGHTKRRCPTILASSSNRNNRDY